MLCLVDFDHQYMHHLYLWLLLLLFQDFDFSAPGIAFLAVDSYLFCSSYFLPLVGFLLWLFGIPWKLRFSRLREQFRDQYVHLIEYLPFDSSSNWIYVPLLLRLFISLFIYKERPYIFGCPSTIHEVRPACRPSCPQSSGISKEKVNFILI